MQVGELKSRVLFVLFGAAMGLLLVEFGSRIGIDESGKFLQLQDEQIKDNQGFFEYDEILGWKGKAFANGIYREPGRSFSVRLNSHGLREREVSFEKTAGTIRVLVLGDSQTWGLGVEQNERFSEILEDLLRHRRVNAEVINFGIPGFGTDQEFLLFTQLGVQYRPDITIVGFYWNDLFENSMSVAYGYPKPRFVQNPAGSLELRNVPVPKKAEEAKQSDDFTRTIRDRIKEEGIWKAAKNRLTANSYAYRLFVTTVKQIPSLYWFSVKLGIAGEPGRDPESREWKVTERLLQTLKEAVRTSGSDFLERFPSRRMGSFSISLGGQALPNHRCHTSK
jgi:hypothetical protein